VWFDGTVARRSDLAAFLRARRAGVSPAEVGLVPGARRRTPGLRREEVALLAGVSVSWYTWLEQGRHINVSADVLDSLARVLRLDAVETDHLHQLAGSPRVAIATSANPDVPPWALRLLDSLAPAPAYVLGPTWDYLAWNDEQAALFPQLATLEAPHRNLVWAMFVVPETRQLIIDWEDEARRVLSQFRADITPLRDDPTVAALIDALHDASDEFATWWERHDVAAFQTRLRRFRTPNGPRVFEYQQLVAAGAPQLRFVVQLPLPPDSLQ
jgi:transcriptional regulator with XRE-family HTH domain